MKLRTKISPEEVKDSGIIAAIIAIGLGFFIKDHIFFYVSLFILITEIVFPVLLYPFALFWFNLAEVLGIVSNKILLTIVFLLILTPVALIKRMQGYDPLRIKLFKSGSESVFTERNHTFYKTDMETLH